MYTYTELPHLDTQCTFAIYGGIHVTTHNGTYTGENV